MRGRTRFGCESGVPSMLGGCSWKQGSVMEICVERGGSFRAPVAGKIWLHLKRTFIHRPQLRAISLLAGWGSCLLYPTELWLLEKYSAISVSGHISPPISCCFTLGGVDDRLPFLCLFISPSWRCCPLYSTHFL